MGIDFTPFSHSFNLWEGSVCNPSWALFDLPGFALTSSGTGPVSIAANPSEGTHNPFDPNSAVWEVSPSTATITPEAADPSRATLECDEDGTYTVTFAGNGRLGRLGRQCEQIEVSCESPVPVCPGTTGNGTIELTGGSLAGQALSASQWEITVSPGQAITGTVEC